MTGKGHPLLGRWRITSMELWDAAFIDLLGSGYIQFDADGGGEIVFGAVQGETACPAPKVSTLPGRAAMRWTTPAVTAMPNSRPMAHSPARSASIAAMNQPSPPASGSFSTAC